MSLLHLLTVAAGVAATVFAFIVVGFELIEYWLLPHAQPNPAKISFAFISVLLGAVALALYYMEKKIQERYENEFPFNSNTLPPGKHKDNVRAVERMFRAFYYGGVLNKLLDEGHEGKWIGMVGENDYRIEDSKEKLEAELEAEGVPYFLQIIRHTPRRARVKRISLKRDFGNEDTQYQYHIRASVNGTPGDFLLDTGSTHVCIESEQFTTSIQPTGNIEVDTATETVDGKIGKGEILLEDGTKFRTDVMAIDGLLEPLFGISGIDRCDLRIPAVVNAAIAPTITFGEN